MIDVHPDIFDAMVAHGCTAGMIVAVYRTLWMGERRPRQVDDAPPLVAGVAPVAPESLGVAPVASDISQESPPDVGQSLSAKQRKCLRDKLYRRNKRAAERAATGATPAATETTLSRDRSDIANDSIDSSSDSAGSLSLSDNNNYISSRERESKSRSESPVSRDRSDSGDMSRNVSRDIISGLMALPADWQPNEKGAKLALTELGEIAAANCLAKFRDHFEDSGVLLTPAQWQGRFRKWVRNERAFAQVPGLPLVRPVKGGKQPARESPSTVWKLEKAVRETLEARRQSG
jgi:hypothetical protein